MIVRMIQLLALVVTALALVPSGAHLAALPNKIHLSQADYFVVQGIYRGWAVLGALWPIALATNAALAYSVRTQSTPFWLAVAAASCFAVMLAVFVAWTLPANQATDNWTRIPEDWTALQRNWEWSHAVNAAIAFGAFCLTALSVLSWHPDAHGS